MEVDKRGKRGLSLRLTFGLQSSSIDMVKKKHGICFSDELWQSLKETANKEDTSIGDFVRRSVRDHLNQHGGYL